MHRISVWVAMLLASGCLEAPVRSYFLVNSTREALSVETRNTYVPQFDDLHELKPGEREVLAMYRTWEVRNFAIEKGLEMRLTWKACQTILANDVLRRRTTEDGKGRWVLELTPELLVCGRK